MHSADQPRSLYATSNEYHSEALARVREQAKAAKKNGGNLDAAALQFAIACHKATLFWLKSAAPVPAG